MKKLLLLPLLRYPTLIGLDKKLESLAKEGRNMDTMGIQNSLLLTLFPTQNRDFRFIVDYNKNALPSYRSEWESLGWELCARFSGYFIWRKANASESAKMPERPLLTARRKKLAASFRTCSFIFLAAALVLLAGMILLIANGHGDKCLKIILQMAVILLVSSYFFWSSCKMKQSL